MRKKLILFLHAAALTLQLIAQQTAHCKMLLKAQSSYTINKETKMNLEMDTGIKGNNPGTMTMRMSAATTSTIGTGVKDNGGLLPVKMLLAAHDITILTNEQELPGSKGVVPPDMHFSGQYQDGQPFRLDSAGSLPLTDSSKKRMALIVDAAMNNFPFPDRPLRLGDSFTCQMPLLLPAVPLSPAAGVKLNITFTLMRIDGDTARFDFIESIATDSKQVSTAVGTPGNITGTGSGKLNFNMKNAFFSDMTSRLSIKYELHSGHSNIKCRGALKPGKRPR